MRCVVRPARQAELVSKRRVRVRVRCPHTCVGQIAFMRGKRELAAGELHRPGRRSFTTTLELNSNGRQALRGRQRVAGRFKTRVFDPRGYRRVSYRRATLTR